MSNPVLSSMKERTRGAQRGSALSLDDVVISTAALLAITVMVGAAAAVLIPDTMQMPVAAAAGIAALAFSLVLCFTRLAFNPVAVMAFAAVEGLVLGPVTAMYAHYYDGVVLGAVTGTVCGFAGMLVAYKVFNVRLSSKTRKVVVASMFGFVAVGLVDVLLMSFGAGIGFAGFGPLGALFSGVGVLLAAMSMLMDFADVEDAIAAGAPQPYKWALSFGLLVSLVWMYTNLLRLLAIVSSD